LNDLCTGPQVHAVRLTHLLENRDVVEPRREAALARLDELPDLGEPGPAPLDDRHVGVQALGIELVPGHPRKRPQGRHERLENAPRLGRELHVDEDDVLGEVSESAHADRRPAMPPDEIIEQRFHLSNVWLSNVWLSDLRGREVVFQGEVRGVCLSLGEGQSKALGDQVDQLLVIGLDGRREETRHDVAHRAQGPGAPSTRVSSASSKASGHSA
jgi:hypothetical protein